MITLALYLLYAGLLLIGAASGLVASLFLFLTVLGFILRSGNAAKKVSILAELGVSGAPESRTFVGFFHPYCNAGGGGERVLWTAIAHLQTSSPDTICAVYTGDVDATKAEIIGKVKARFAITLDPKSLHFVYLQSRDLVEDTRWRHFTLLGQSIGSMVLALEGLSQLIPDIYIDSMGYAFTFHVVRLLAGRKAPIGAYVHYPTISTDMLQRVRQRKTGHTNAGSVASSNVLSQAKLIYYRIFAWLYSVSLSRASYIMVNSSWTKDHVDSLLAPRRSKSAKTKKDTEDAASTILYPPCNTESMKTFPLEKRQRFAISISQFRPEKEHATQLRALDQLFKKKPAYRTGSKKVQLVLIGSSRNEEDAKRVVALRDLAKTLDIEANVAFVVNAPYEDLLTWLSTASIGLNTMVDEHFGINVVEFMAAGLIPIVHASGGPKQDIVVPYQGEATGYHATDAASFADRMDTAFSLPESEAVAMRRRARALAAERFSEEEFVRGWDVGWAELLRMRGSSLT